MTEIFGRIGLFRLMATPPDQPPKGLTRREAAAISMLMSQFKNQVANMKGVPVGPSAEQARAAGGLENLPLIVLSAETTAPGVSAEYEQTRIEILARFAHRSKHGKHVVVKNSGHMIPRDAPESVIEAVREVVRDVRVRRSVR